MKKHLFFLFAALTLLTAPGAMRAQTTVTIGNESSTGSAYIMPVNMYYNYSLTQQIYRADEINMPDGGTITSISFEYLYSEAFSLSGIKVFMKNTTKESFTNNNDWVEVSASDKVFEGTFSASGAGWVTLTLNTPFHYDGTSNLLVCFYDPTNGYPGSSYKFRTTSTTSDYPDQYLALTCNSDSDVPDPDDLYSYSGAKGLQTIRNNIRLTINPDITEVFVNDVTLPAWGGHPDYDWSVPSGANYYINATESKWQDATTSGNLFSGNVFNQVGHDYVLKLQFESIYGWHISNNVAVYLNDDPSLIASTAFNTSGRLVAQTIPFNVYPYDVVNIGDGTVTSYYAPYNSLWEYSFVEQIYTADEIAMPAGGAVTSISFNMQSSEQQTNHITVYMKNVSRSAFDNSNDYETVTSSDIVFEGDYTFVQGWNTITLDVPFLYNGTDNLMIAFHENTPGYSTRHFYYTYKEGSVLSAHSDYDDPDPYDLASFPGTKYIQNYRANIRIAFVEPIVEIGSGNGSSNYLPTYTFYKYSLTEQIYTAAEIGQAGDIYTISFYNTNDAGTRDLDIYMTVSDKNTFSGPTNWTGGAPSNLVFSGEVDFEADGWTTIELSNPFYYPGVYNIVLTVDDNTGYYDHSRYFKTFDATGQALRISSDVTDYDPWYTSSYNGTVLDVKNQIRFGFAPVTCTAPTNLTVSNIGSVGAGVSWDQSGDSDHWIVQCSANSDFSTASEVSVGSPYWYIYSLNPNTTYFVRVANDCGSGNISSWSNTVTFTTTESPCIAPTDLTVSNVSYNGADLTWDQPGDGYEWLIEYSINPEFSSSSYESSFDPYLSLTGLDPITTYYVRVANECGTLGNSEWITTSFTTTGGVIVIPDIIDFEPGDFSQYPFVNDATYPWIIVDASDGCDNGSTYCMRSGNAGIASSSSTIEATYDYPDAGYITFDAKCMGEGTNWDVCKFFIDGVLQFSYGEYMAGWNHYSYIVPAGTHTFTWSYTKDSSEDPDGDGFFVDNIEFGIGMPCLTPPIDLTAYNITDNSVDVSWTGSGEAYTVKYRPVLLFDDFENGLSQWTQIDADGDGYGWLLGNTADGFPAHDGTTFVYSESYDDTEGALTPDNYLVSPLLSLGGQLEFWARAQELSYPNEHFSIAVSTTGNTDPADFQTVPGAEWTLSADEWQQFIVDLSAYAGEQGYVALRHHDCTDQYYLDVDDFIIYAPGEWQTVTTTSDNTHLTGLNPETQYIFQVQSDCGSDGTSEWSELKSFITTNVTCSAPTNLNVTDVTENTASLSWTGPSDGIEWDLWYSTTSDFATFGHEIVDATTWTLEGLTAGTTYYARVRTFCGTMGNSEWSNTVTFTTSAEGPTTVVEIGDGTTTYYYLPVNMYFNYSLTQQIFTPDEIGTAGIIHSISFDYDYTQPFSMDNIQVYMLNTDKEVFENSTDMVQVTPADLVFQGTFSASGAGWTTITLDTPFEYDGESNLLVCCYDPTSGYPGSYYKFKTSPTADYKSISYYSDSYVPDLNNINSFTGNNVIHDFHNNIRLEITPGVITCYKPTHLTVTDLTYNTASLTWEGAATNGFVLEYKEVSETIWNHFTTTVSYWDLSGLDENTTYNVRVKADCGAGDESNWRSITFTTPEQCPTPTDIEVEPGSNRVTITWNGGNNSSDFGEFKVRKAGHYADTLFFDGFENGLDQWTVYVEGDASHNGWLQVDPRTYLHDGANYMDRTPYRGDYVAYASSYDGSSFDADNWLVTPQLELQGVVNFWVENRASNYLDSYEVLLSTGSNSPSDFTVTLQAMTQPSTEWSEVTLDLSAYAGQQGYIAIRQSSYDMEGILLDNFGIYNNYQEPSAWLTGVTAYSPATFEEAFYSNFMAESMPIEPGTKYDFMIMEQCDGGGGALYGSSSAWTEIHSFVTYPCEVSHLIVEKTTNGEAEVSWTSGAGVFELRYRPEGSGSWTTVTGITDNSYMITGLPAGNYEVEVAPNCDPTNFTSTTFNIVNVQSTANWYTYANYNDDASLEYLYKFVSFSMENPTVVAEASSNIDDKVRSATCVNGQVWFTTYDNNEYVYRAPLDNVNKTIGAYEAVSSLSLSGYYAHAMSYNPDDGQIYYVVYDGGYTLNKFDPTLASPVSSLVGTFSISVSALAINSAGEAYCLDENGNFYQVNLTDATTTLVANTGKSTGNYWQSMAFDLNTGELFWSQYYENDIGLYLVEPATATVHQVGHIGDGNTQFIGMFMVADETPTQPLVEIGSGESTNGYLPTYILYNYTLSQQIYTAAEIGQAGDIYSVAFYNTSTNGTTTRDIDIYMLHSDKTTFSDASDFVPVTAADLVFSGYVTVDPNCWITIELSTPFAYNGTDNLILIVDDNTGTWTSSRYFRAFNAPSQAIRVYNDDTDYDPYNPSAYSGAVLDVKNQIQLGFVPILCHKPASFSVYDVGISSASLNWTETGTATTWQICVNGDEDHLINVTSTNYTFTGLTPGTTYSVKVRANCGGSDGVSEWSMEKSFTTYTCEVSDLTVTTTLAGDANLTWDGHTASYILRYRPEGGSWTTVSGITDNSYTITGLPVGDYEVEVAPDCDPTNFTSTTFSVMEVLSTANWYGHPVYTPDGQDWLYKYVSFSVQNPAVVTPATEVLTTNSNGYTYAAALVDGYVWCITVEGNLARAVLDNDSKTISAFETVVPGFESTYSSSMSYNPVDGRLYYIMYNDHKLKSFSPSDVSDVVEVGEYSIDALTLAINSAGEAYCMDMSTGDLYQINLSDASTTLVGNTGLSVGYAQDMAFDLTTGELFWTRESSSGRGLYLVSTSTATAMFIGTIGGGQGAEVTGLFMGESTTLSCPFPTNLTVSGAIETNAVMSWTENGTATAWDYQIDTDPAFPNGELSQATVSDNPYTLSGLTTGTTYYVRVRANCGGGEHSFWSFPVSFTVYPCELTDVTVTSSPNGTATVNWSGHSNSYSLVYRPVGTSEWTGIENINANSYTITNLTPGEYEVEVAASCDPSVWVSATFTVTEVLSTANWYGFSTSSFDAINYNKFISFTMDNPATVTAATGNVGNGYGRGSAYANGYLWNITEGGVLTRATVDDDNKVISAFEVVVSGFETAETSALSYNPVDGRMYYTFYSDQTLKSFDPAQPDNVTTVGDCGIVPIAFAINALGEAYCIEKGSGDLYRVNLNDASVTLVGSTGHPTNYVQSMAFDYQTGELFWAQHYSVGSDNYGLYKVNPATAETFSLGRIGGGNVELTGLFMVADVPPTCPAPTDLAVETTHPGDATFSWTSGNDYNLRLREVGGEWMYFGQVSSPYPVTTLDANTDYEAQAQLDCGSDGLSDWGNLVSFTTLPCPAPTNLTVSDITLTSAELSWSQSGGGYEWNVEYSTSFDFSSSTTEWVLSSSYSMANLAPGTTYYVRVQSICPISIPGGVSDVVTFTTEECPAPTNVTVSNITSTTAEINWTQSGAGFEWDIEYSTSSDFSTYHTVWAIDYPWTLDNLVPETTYYVRVKSACYDHIEGGTSAAVTFTTSSVSCSAPTNLTVTNVTKNSATVDWTETGSATTWFVVLNNDLDNAIELIGHPYTLLGLTPETEYTVAVYASCDLDVTSPLSTPVTFTTEGCTAPNDLTLVSAGAVSASLSWASGDTYRLRYRTASGEWMDATAEGVTSPFSLSGLQTGTAYEVQAQRDCGADGLSPWGNIVSFTTETCGVPTDLELLSVSANSITITWASGLPYNVRYRRTTGESDLWHQVTNKIPPYTINGLLPGNTYRVQVQDICATGGNSSTFSTALVVTTLSCTTPDDVTVTDITNNSANVTWTSGSTYNLRYRENGGAWTNVTGATSPYALTGLHPNSFYELQAQKDCGADGLSSWSDVVTFTTAPSIVPTVANITGNSSVCPGNTTELTATSDVEVSYLWSTGETTQTITVGPGDYSVIVTSTTGDELASGIFTVSLKESYTTEDNQSVCQNELPYVWNGESYSTPGNYTKTLTAANGCDSVVTLHLTVNSTYAVTDTRAVCPSELPYTWNGFTFHSAGTQPVTLQTVNGCDSVVTMTLTLNQTYNTPVTATICQGDSYSFFGQTLTAGGTYTHTLQTVNGCDSVITLTLTVNPTYAVTDQRTVCPGELPLTWNGKTFTEAGTKTATLQTVNGCDSTVTMTLHVFPTYNVPVTATVCQGESYSFFGQTLTAGGTYTHTLQTVNGCDSIVTLTLTVNPTYAVTDTRTVCPSELPLAWNGKTFTEAGTQTATLQTANGCDSTVTMTLHVNPAYNVPVTAAICQGDSYSFFGQTLTTGGIYTHTLQTVNGCDSVITLTLTVNPTYLITEERTVCSAGLPYLWNGVVFTGPGTKFASLHTATGCDSVVTMILTVDEAFEVTVNRAVCVDELPIVWNGKTFNAAGTQTVTLEASNGCDSIVTMVVTVNTPVHQAYTVVECGSYTWTNGDGATYTASGTHTYSHTDANGCTQVDTLHLTIHNPVHTAVTVSECGSYTWNGQTYTTSGNYTYSHTDANGCTQVDTLHLTIYNPVNTAITAQACGSFVWNGETYTTSGTHTFSHTDAHGCTQVDTLHLTIFNPVHQAVTVSECGSYTWTAGNGQTYTASGDYTYSHLDAHGCTQVDTLHLTIFNPVHQAVTVSECGSYTWTAGNGQTYTASGDYTHSHLDANGCTQVDTLHLTIFNPVHTAVTVSECGSYTWNGQTYTASGNYTYSHLDANGCTQVDTLHLTILNPVHQAITVSECGSYTWAAGNGQTYTTSGNYTYSHLDANGCTQVDTLHLTIFNPMHTAVTVSACGSYTWADGNGQTYITSGNYTYSHLDAHGCTQVDTLHLTILHGSSAVVANTICASELPYEWNGVTFTEAGMQTATIDAANGCDSVVTMVLMVNTPVHHAYTAEACGSYTWNGTVYSVSGNYTYSHQDVNGCTQVDTLHLTIFQPANIAITVAECGSYTWTSGNGVTYTASGNYTYSHTDANGCTQVDTLHLTIHNPVHQAVTVSECGSYTWNGTVYETSGTYTYSHLDNNGCTQVDTLHLTINNPVHQAITVTECGDYTWNGQTYTESGDYTYSHLDNNGCTQVDTLHLTINHPAGTAVTVTECASYTWTDGNGQTYTESGIYTYSHLDVVGCTQVDTLYLTINEPEATTLTATVCPAALPYTWNGVVFTAAGTQSVTLTAANGCDSVVTMTLTVIFAAQSDIYETACGSYFWNNANYTESGDYTATFTAANGCDSIVTLHLTINQSVQTELYETACDSYTWTDGNTYTQSDDYAMTLTAANGCDSIVVLHLTIHNSATSEFSIEWMDDTPYTWNGQEYTESGDYTQTLQTVDGCDSVVTLHLTITVDVDVYDAAAVYIAPNPAKEVCRIVGLESAPISVDLFDMRGKLLMRARSTEFDVRTLPSGMYMVKVNTGDRIINLKLIRQ